MASMVLYLCQHGDALSGDVDPDRPLSERGTADVCNMANALSGNIETGVVVHSGKTRARQTAELLHERLAPQAVIQARDGLAPNDPVDAVADGHQSREANLLVVGHMPFVSRLASHLMGIDREILAFRPAAIAAMNRDSAGGWVLAWMLTPELASR